MFQDILSGSERKKMPHDHDYIAKGIKGPDKEYLNLITNLNININEAINIINSSLWNLEKRRRWCLKMF